MFIDSKQYFKIYNLSKRKYSTKGKITFNVSKTLQDFKIKVTIIFFTTQCIEICRLPVQSNLYS